MPDNTTLRTLIVDDSAMYRKIIEDVLYDFPYVEIVGTAQNGKIALEKTATLKPDMLILDIEMPEMDGLEVLEGLRKKNSDISSVVFSTFSTEGADITLKALELGAFDFIPKPGDGNLDVNKGIFKSKIAPILDTLFFRKKTKFFRKKTELKNDVSRAIDQSSYIRKSQRSKAVAIGISTGGPVALTRVIPAIPADIGVPIFIVQHMPPIFTETLAEQLDSISKISVKEAADGQIIYPNTAYIAPGGKQMKIDISENNARLIIKITDDPAENNCKPSADYLFRSVATHYGRNSTGVIMTGMGSDGTEGLKLMKARGATIIAQDEATSVVYSMPRKPVEIGIVDVIAPLDSITDEICRTVGR